MITVIEVGTVKASRGERVTGHLEVGKTASGYTLTIPVIIVQGNDEGPTLWLNGAVHGDEINGIVAIRKVAFSVDPKELKGTLICTPMCNPPAFQVRHKLSGFDSLDMDQQFPGNPEGLLTERIAHILFGEIKDTADYLINFHTIGRLFLGRPYTVFKLVDGAKPELLEEIEKTAKSFGTYLNCRVDLRTAAGELPGRVEGALDVNCIKNGIAAFMAEVGSGGRLEEENIDIACTGIRNVMKRIKMIPGEPTAAEEQVTLTWRKFIRCNEAGLVFMKVKPYERVAKGTVLAEIADLFGNVVEEVRAPRDCYVICARFDPVVHTGDRIAFVGSC